MIDLIGWRDLMLHSLIFLNNYENLSETLVEVNKAWSFRHLHMWISTAIYYQRCKDETKWSCDPCHLIDNNELWDKQLNTVHTILSSKQIMKMSLKLDWNTKVL